jgi:hypothetical protein
MTAFFPGAPGTRSVALSDVMLPATPHRHLIPSHRRLALSVLDEDARNRRFLGGKFGQQRGDLPFEDSPFALQCQLLPLGFLLEGYVIRPFAGFLRYARRASQHSTRSDSRHRSA